MVEVQESLGSFVKGHCNLPDEGMKILLWRKQDRDPVPCRYNAVHSGNQPVLMGSSRLY